MSRTNLCNALVLNRRAFLAALGSVTVLVSSCGVTGKTSDPIASAIEKIVQSKRALIADATALGKTDPSIKTALQTVINQNLLHIESLLPYLTSEPTPLTSAATLQEVSLPAIATRCQVFSANHLNAAISTSDSQLSRLLALIAGSEITHHALLSGFIK